MILTVNARLFKAKDFDLSVKMNQFIQVVTDHQAEFGLSAQDIAEITALGGDYDESLGQVSAARNAYRAAVEGKDEAREGLVDKGREIARKLYANPAIEPSLIVETGLSLYDTVPTQHSPKSPKSLVAVPNANGTALLKWDGNGNARGAIYLIEAKSPGEEWTMIATTTKHRITLRDQPPGVPRSYRVVASRNERRSTPSTRVQIYGPGIGLAKAA